MGGIYSHSSLTLAASSAADSYGGCRVGNQENITRPDHQWFDFERKGEWFRIFITPFPPHWQTEYLAGPLRRRAWALQERELSNRVLHYTENVLLWECKSAKACSDQPWVEVQDKDLPSPSYGRGPHLKTDLSKRQRNRWFSIVEDYSERTLTFGTDKLPALSGLAHETFSIGDRYLAGMWQRHLPLALLWRTRAILWSESPPKRPPAYIAPTWSWASIDGCVTYDVVAELADPGDIFESPRPTAVSKAIQIAIDVKPAGRDAMGQISSGQMRLKARLKSAILRGKDYHYDNKFYSGGWRKLLDGSNEFIGFIAPDVLPEPTFEETIFCVSLSTSANRSPWFRGDAPLRRPGAEITSEEECVGLALKAVETKSNTYTRIGLVRWMESSSFKYIEECEVTII